MMIQAWNNSSQMILFSKLYIDLQFELGVQLFLERVVSEQKSNSLDVKVVDNKVSLAILVVKDLQHIMMYKK